MLFRSNIMGGGPEAQMAAARARQVQMRQALAAQQQQQLGEGSRQMSPPSSMGGGMPMSSGDPSPMSSMPQMNAGPNVQQLLQIMQTPNHPLMHLCAQQVPGFMQMQVQEKLQKMHMVQASPAIVSISDRRY